MKYDPVTYDGHDLISYGFFGLCLRLYKKAATQEKYKCESLNVNHEFKSSLLYRKSGWSIGYLTKV